MSLVEEMFSTDSKKTRQQLADRLRSSLGTTAATSTSQPAASTPQQARAGRPAPAPRGAAKGAEVDSDEVVEAPKRSAGELLEAGDDATGLELAATLQRSLGAGVARDDARGADASRDNTGGEDSTDDVAAMVDSVSLVSRAAVLAQSLHHLFQGSACS
jgi:hypothetical protein